MSAPPADTYRVAGVTVTLVCADPTLRQLVRNAWSAFRMKRPDRRTSQAVFRFPDRTAGALRRLKTWHTFVSDRMLVLSDGRRYLLTGILDGPTWQFDCRSLPDWDPDFVYYYVCEPLLLDVLKRHGVLVWHSAAVERHGRAVLLPAVSGRGKSTTVLNLLTLGYRFLADDVVILRRTATSPTVAGFESGLYLTPKSVRLLPEWAPHVSGGRHKKGRQWKRRVDLGTFTSRRARPPRATTLLFPQIGTGRETRLEPLTATEALVACLAQRPKEFPASTLGPSALESQFNIYADLAQSTRSYRLVLGSDQDRVRAVLSRLDTAR